MPCLPAELEKDLDIARRRDDEAALAQDQLHHDTGDLLGGDVGGEELLELVPEGGLVRGETGGSAVEVGIGQAVDLGGEGSEAELVGLDLAGHRHAEERAAVEGVLEDQHRLAAGRPAGDLHRVLDRLDAAVGEQRLLGEGTRNGAVETLGELDVALVGGHREAAVGESPELGACRLDDRRMSVADVQRPDAAGEIDEGVAVDVVEESALGALDEHRRGVPDAHGNGRLAPRHEGARPRSGDFRFQLDRSHRGEPHPNRCREAAGSGSFVLADSNTGPGPGPAGTGRSPQARAAGATRSLPHCGLTVTRFGEIFADQAFGFLF